MSHLLPLLLDHFVQQINVQLVLYNKLKQVLSMYTNVPEPNQNE